MNVPGEGWRNTGGFEGEVNEGPEEANLSVDEVETTLVLKPVLTVFLPEQSHCSGSKAATGSGSPDSPVPTAETRWGQCSGWRWIALVLMRITVLAGMM